MTKPTLTVKHQTTVPEEVREKIHVEPSDVLPDVLSLQGKFKVGPGDPVKDVRRARQLMGTSA
jgi:bifunctional DNA-binding transcriptional regulator/antitoxin component of YhaV-PrlF toxin-antitoxin module